MNKKENFSLFINRCKVAGKALALIIVLVIAVVLLNPFISIDKISGVLSAIAQAAIELVVLAAISVRWKFLGRGFDWVDTQLNKLFSKVSSLWKHRKS